MFDNKVVLITGGTGSWGNELVRQLLDNGACEIRIFSRGELSQVMMQRDFNDNRLRFIIGDVRDQDAINKAAQGVDYIFHLAALKHVPICEEHPEEAVKTNIQGVMNVIDAAVNNNVCKVVYISSDKAVEPLNLYGMTKAAGEKLIVNGNKLNSSTRFVCVRAGNILGSNGSILPYFIDQIKKHNRIRLTDEKMTRFFLTLPDAVKFLCKAADISYGGEIFVIKMPSCYILDLARVLIGVYGSDSTELQTIGVRPGEKTNEVLLSQYEAENSYYYDDYLLIMPSIKVSGLFEHYNRHEPLKKVDFMEYTSVDKPMDAQQIKSLLQKGGFI